MQDKNVIKLTDQDAALLEQGASMLEGLENDERNRGNCSAAEGAGCSAHAVRRLVSALLAHDREIGQCLHQIQEPAAAEQAAWHAGLDEGRAQAGFSVSNEETPQAAPAAVAVPAELMGLLEALESMVDVCEGHDFDGAPSDAHMEKARAAISTYRAALAATPAAAPVDKSPELQGSMVDKTVNLQDAAAAPVVQPEPVDDSLSLMLQRLDSKSLAEWADVGMGLAENIALHVQGDCNLRADQARQKLRAHLFSLQPAVSLSSALLATATGLPAQATWLQPKDLEALQRFEETASDNQRHDIGKAAVARLTGFGCLQSHGFGTYSITDFGHFVLDDWEHARALPFRTQADRDADQRAAIAAAKGE